MRKTYDDGHIPEAGTNFRIVLDYFFEVGEATTETARVELADQLERDVVTAAISNLRGGGLLTEGKEGIRVSALMRRNMEEAASLANKAILVAPRQVNVLTAPPLHPSRYLSTKGTRPDSDWSGYPSLAAPFSKSA